MSDWNPIETAPKDGRLILGYDAKFQDLDKHAQAYGAVRDEDYGDFHRVAPYEIVCWIEGERNFMVQVDRDNYKRKTEDNSFWARSQGSWFPTHWMVLPTSPEPSK